MFPDEISDHVAHITWHLSISTVVNLLASGEFLGNVCSPRFSLESPAPGESNPGAFRSRPRGASTRPSSRHRRGPWKLFEWKFPSGIHWELFLIQHHQNATQNTPTWNRCHFWPEKGFLDLIQPLLCVGFLHVLDQGEEVVSLSLELGARVHLGCHHLQWRKSEISIWKPVLTMASPYHLLNGHLNVVHPLDHLADPGVVHILDERVVLAPERHVGNWISEHQYRLPNC